MSIGAWSMRIVQGIALMLGVLALAGALFPNSLIPVGHAIAQSLNAAGQGGEVSGSTEQAMVELDPTMLVFNRFYDANRRDVLLSHKAGDLCIFYECNGLDQEVAEQIALFAVAEREREDQTETQAESRWLARIGLACSAFGAFLGFMAFRRSQLADTTSARNEKEMTALKKQTGV